MEDRLVLARGQIQRFPGGSRGSQPLLAIEAIMTSLFCVTVVAILAAGVLMKAIFHSSVFFFSFIAAFGNTQEL